MPELTKEDIAIIHATHDAVIKIEIILDDGKGGGLCHDVQNHNKRLTRIELFIAFLIGSGVLTGGAVGLLKLLG